MRAGAQRVRVAVESYGGPFAGPGPPRASALPQIDGPTLIKMLADQSVMGAARTKQFALEIYLVELVQLRTVVESIIALIERNLDAESRLDSLPP